MIISGSDLRLPFTGRDSEASAATEFLVAGSLPPASNRQVIVLGASGSGKTRLVEEVLDRVVSRLGEDALNAYWFDALTDCGDEAVFLETVIYGLWFPQSYRETRRANILRDDTFESFVRRHAIRTGAKDGLLSALCKSLSFIPHIGHMFEDVSPDAFKPDTLLETPDLADLLMKYLRRAVAQRPLFFVLDNAQELQTRSLMSLRTILGAVQNNVRLVTIIRKSHENTARDPLPDCTVFREHIIVPLSEFSLSEARQLLARVFSRSDPRVLQELVDDAYRQSQGNLKHLQQYVINRRLFAPTNEASPLSSHWGTHDAMTQTLLCLSHIERQIVFLAALFPDGINVAYVRRILQMHLSPAEEFDLVAHLDFLMQCQLVYLNGPGGRLLKPRHEAVIRAAPLTFSDEEVIEVRRACLDVFRHLADQTKSSLEFVHAVGMMLGLQTLHELKQNLQYVIRVIQLLDASFRYALIESVYRRIRGEGSGSQNLSWLATLPGSTIVSILNALQKTAAFGSGLEFTDELTRRRRDDLGGTLDKYRAKYLIQTYRYEEGVAVLPEQDNDYESIAIRLNALQHLRCDADVLQRLESLRFPADPGEQKYYFLALRNAVHLGDRQQSVTRLKRVLDYFQQANDRFLEATALNNLGLAYLYAGHESFDGAPNCFRRAQRLFEALGSREFYQPKVNEGLWLHLQGEHEPALECYDEARYVLPEALLFDRIKLDSNILVARYCARQINAEQGVEECEHLLEQAQGFPDPWLPYQVRMNLGAIQILSYAPELSRVGLENLAQARRDYGDQRDTYGIEYTPPHATALVAVGRPNFILGTSPHWRF